MTSDTAVCTRAIPDAKCAYNSSRAAFVSGITLSFMGRQLQRSTIAVLGEFDRALINSLTCDLFKL